MTRHWTILLFACAPLFGQQYTISTVAGNGAVGPILNYPTSVALDSGDNIYIGDWSGFIRKIWAGGGAITTVAGAGILGYGGDGGRATSAMLGRAISIALDAVGNIYGRGNPTTSARFARITAAYLQHRGAIPQLGDR